jgi:hypothetical protein
MNRLTDHHAGAIRLFLEGRKEYGTFFSIFGANVLNDVRVPFLQFLRAMSGPLNKVGRSRNER